ncbi:tRNA (adenosine(37)-N6)-threonylcarbamoyltransferase complex ATPase subunit type 1 TsaE [Candidatus Parcubacteria bacterium]|nr:MAG: tRNA (adenosine(37)-N6)-threonylcarbamoyltransferase complex ATPase subunit type 1 TsaE [Candidatus Parcubacteria bacterium]
MEKIEIKNIEETKKLAYDLVGQLQGGELIALVGNLGAGKTVFVKAMAQALAVEDNVTSPTFVLLKVYKTKHQSIKKLVHVDCYRLEGKEDLADIGLAEYIEDPEALVVIEWADKIHNLPAERITINIKNLGGDLRSIEID